MKHRSPPERDPELERLRDELERCVSERSELAQQELGHRRLIENLTGGYFFYRHDIDRSSYYVSAAVERVLGYSPEEFVKRYGELFTDSPVNAEARQRTERAMAGEAQYSFEVELRSADGDLKVLEVSEMPVSGSDDGVSHVEGIAHEHHRTELAERHLRDLATIDELTGLFNRRHLRVRLEEAVALARRHGFPMSMALLDLDGLKETNDVLGHAAGDRLICAAARILKHELRRGDVLGRLERVAGRLGGDEFAAILPYAEAGAARIGMERVLAAFAAESVEVGPGTTRALRASVGVAELRAGEEAAALERRADDALYRAKRAGRGGITLAEGDGT